mgnify:CR=1 FL=1|tara:strand:- start:1504 stop:2388 length:885 start_codon:yes stop_codon:yes gene_type:complete
MIITLKSLKIKNTTSNAVVNITSKNNFKLSLRSKEESIIESKNKSLICSPLVKNINTFSEVNNIVSLFSFNRIASVLEDQEIIIEDELVNIYTFIKEYTEGFRFISMPIDISQSILQHAYMAGYSEGDIIDYTLGADMFVNFFKNNVYENEDDLIPLYYKDQIKYDQTILFVKDSAGGSYLPEYQYSGIGNFLKNFGYTVKFGSNCYLKITAKKYEPINNISDYNFNYENGWFYVSFKSLLEINAVDFFKPLTDQNKIHMIKSDVGGSYIPQYNYNGIGNLIPGESYSVKFKNI